MRACVCVSVCSLSVRVVRSNRSGVGKTLYKQRLSKQLRKRLGRRKRSVSVSIPLHCRVADMASIAALLLEHTLEPVETLPRIIHLDISYQVERQFYSFICYFQLTFFVVIKHKHIATAEMGLYI